MGHFPRKHNKALLAIYCTMLENLQFLVKGSCQVEKNLKIQNNWIGQTQLDTPPYQLKKNELGLDLTTLFRVFHGFFGFVLT